MRFFSVIVVLIISTRAAVAAEPTKAQLDFFEKTIRPLLIEKCHRCHGPDKQKSGLRLDTKDGFLTGGESGPAYNSETPGESLLLDAIRYGRFQMPPDRKLADDEIAAMEKWIKAGAAWPDKK
ncbi:MAG TPA: c-type cytochrome domain-containing protein [Planctomycetaceae bacterium]|nr:c-type cytochrome domain-containing protein [Planctomycetaceae bacterium]